MRILLYIVILAAVLVIPSRGTDVGKLIPVELIAVSESEGTITVRTDTGDEGKGTTIDRAISDLKDTAAGIIYLDTAEYLLLQPGMNSMGIREYLKGCTRVFWAAEGIPLEGIANYLSVHGSGARLKELSESSQIPTIREENGRYRILEK